MKKLLTVLFAIACFNSISKAQCNWQPVMSDGFEYTTICPNLVPGTTIHNTPQSFAVHSGTYSLYLNFVNCVNGTGTCPGAMVYERGFTVCRNQPLRFTSWITTSFGGTQCDIRMVVKDGNGTILNDQLHLLAPYAPQWLQYQSGSVTPITDSVVVVMYTNVGGGGGNDLSMDDFTMEKCVGGGNSTTTAGVCDNNGPVDLYTYIPGTNVPTGTWTGPGTLGGGYLGTFDPSTGTPGNYVYESPGFGTLPGCPLTYDTLLVQLQPGPAVNLGADTTICTNQSLLLVAGNTPGNTYLWQNGITSPTQLAFTISTVDTSYTYSVTVTGTGGCIGLDTIAVNFVVCTGVEDLLAGDEISLFPVPANEEINIRFTSTQVQPVNFSLYAPNGNLVLEGNAAQSEQTLALPKLASGVYSMVFSVKGQQPITRKLVIRN